MLVVRRFRRLKPLKSLVRFCATELIHKDTFIEKLRKSYVEDEKSNLVVPTFKKAMLFPDEIAIKDVVGEFTYFQLYVTAKKLSIQISNICGSASQSNVVFLSPNNAMWLIIQWGIWISGQVAVPVDQNGPHDQLRRQAENCKTKLIIGTPECEVTVQELAQVLETAIIIVDHDFVPTLESVSSTTVYAKQLVGTKGTVLTESTLPNEFYAKSSAMLLYTPDCSNNQKAVVLTHRNVDAQQRSLIASWRLRAGDCLFPLISINRMQAAFGALLSIGGNLILQQNFDSHTAWSALLGINSPCKQRVSLFMAMPIIYKQLIAEYDKMFAQDQRMVEYIMNHCKTKIRLMGTAFALLPDPVFHRWREITGQNIYEFYGMLETGLVLGHPIKEHCETDPPSTATAATAAPAPAPAASAPVPAVEYRPGSLGLPLPGVSVRLMDNSGKTLIKRQSLLNDLKSDGTAASPSPKEPPTCEEENPLPSQLVNAAIGELQIAGDGVSSNYLNQSDNTEKLADGFFKTNDICAYQNGGFQFLSKSNDVFTVGGYKIYGSEIKKVLITHPSIKDVAVLGIPNKLWGHRLGVICIVSPDANLDLDSIKSYCYRQLPVHKRPTVFKTIVSK
ncbi:malonate--CoA ligase ACSF3, mitochondrial [Scaptodrosophila lebanonensis]|uniref:Malonate--CoA ligase ACSF3, mitochondrial n=1 Tax=Drosophila lebanonensis TaxID=7225 RepID=A0A6J2U3M3_DROLE|nr:malonate--CoA ligase ACSF3, mitochondrial [Scaptodrosophila lebanonensis]